MALVHELNPAIATGLATGADVSALQEQRAAAINRIAEIIDIRQLQQSDGRIFLYTASGLTVLDQAARRFVYEPVGTADTTSRFAAIELQRQDASGAWSSTGETVETRLRGGTIKALIDMRDTELPQL